MFSSLKDLWQVSLLTLTSYFYTKSTLKRVNHKFLPIFFQKYDPQRENFWIINPFTEDIKSCNLNAAKKELLIELVCNTKLKIKHENLPLSQF